MLVLLFVALLALLGVGFLYVRRGTHAPRPIPPSRVGSLRAPRPDLSSDESDESDEAADDLPDGLRRRRRQPRHRAHSGERDGDGDGAKLSRLQRKKLEKARERAARQESQEQRAEQRRARDDLARQRQESEEQRARDDAAREAAEEEALAELRAERRQREDEEYAKWVGAIGVEGRGELGDEERLQRERVDEFLTARAREVEARAAQETQEAQEGAGNIIVLGDTARGLGVSAEALAQRIERLLADGVVSGVFDERGKFVFVAEVHFRRLATFVQQRGRVSVRELARECNRVILA